MNPGKLLIVAGSLLCPSSVFAASIIDSIYGAEVGSFEYNAPDIPFYATYAAGSTSITGWTVGSGSVDWVRNTVWTASHGSYSIDLNGTVPAGDPPAVGSISTIIPTTIGTTYRVTFDISGFLSFGNTANPKQMELSVKSVNLLAEATEISNTTHEFFATNNSETLPITLGWESRTVTFVATEAQTSVTFISRTTTNQSGIYLDNVAIEAVPEPAAAVLLSIGTACGFLRRRRPQA